MKRCTLISGCIFLSSSVGGLILDKTVTNPNFVGMAVFTPVINGTESHRKLQQQRPPVLIVMQEAPPPNPPPRT